MPLNFEKLGRTALFGFFVFFSKISKLCCVGELDLWGKVFLKGSFGGKERKISLVWKRREGRT